jgi:Icc-related predicted phosphoesterase
LPKVEDCDLVLLAGDLCPFGPYLVQLAWMNSVFRRWLEDLHERKIPVVGIAGNHDEIMEERPDMMPYIKWIYLQDTSVTINGLKIWGTPWVLPYGDWAFMRPEEWLKERFSYITEDVDIIITHGPPYGYGDKCPKTVIDIEEIEIWESQGSKAMLETLDRVKPKLIVFGHIHQGRGLYKRNNTILCNAAIWDHHTDTVHEPTVVYLD